MGFGTKLKDALSGDHHETTYEETKPPGAFPEEGTGRHSDGRQVVLPNGSAVPSSGKAGTSRMTGPAYDQQRYEPGTVTAVGHRGLGATGSTAGPSTLESDSRHNKVHKLDDPRSVEGSREYGRRDEGLVDPTREKGVYGPGHSHHDSGVDLGRTYDKKDHPYWGDMDERQCAHQGATEGVAAGAGTAGAGYGASRLAEKEFPDRTRHGHETRGMGPGSKNDELRPTGEAVGGGVYNTVPGAGSPEQSEHHVGHRGQLGHPGPESRTTGTNGDVGGPTSGYSDTRYDPKNGARDSIPTSRDDRTAPGVVGAGVVGAGAGIGAGLGASELSRKHHEKDIAEYGTPPNHHNRGTHEPGVPHSSMLDPFPSKDYSRTAHNDTTAPRSGGMLDDSGHRANKESRFDSGPGIASHPGPESSRFENESRSGMGPTSETSRFDSAPRSGMGPPTESSRFDNVHGSGMGPAAAAGAGVGSGAVGSGMGKNHYGPAHEGATVMHTCHNCGADNDISHYFKKDAVYRIGS